MKTLDFYNKEIMSRYQPKIKLEKRENVVLDLLRKVPFDENASMLDVGCGDGFFLHHLSKTIPRMITYYGVDYSEDQISAARKKYPFIFNTCNLEEGLPFDDNVFDLVYAGEVIEHLYNPDFFFTEAFRVLKEQGHLLLSTPNLNAWISRMLFLFGYQPLFYEVSTKASWYGYGFMKNFKKQDWPVGHVRLFNRRSLTDALTDNGFSVMICRGAVFEYMPRPLNLMDRLFAMTPNLASDLVVLAHKRKA